MLIPKRTIHLVSILAPLLVLAGAVTIQLRYDAIVAERFVLQAPLHRSLMPATVVRHLGFGFNNVLADYYWVNAVQDYLNWDSFDTYYPEYFHIISALDAHFEYPYLFAILTVPNKKNPDSLQWLAEIAEEGIRAFPEDYRIPFSTATQFHIVGKDNARAIHFLEIATAKVSAPELVHRTYAIYLMRDATDYKKSRALFETILDTDVNPETQKIVTERILLLDFIESIEQTIATYKVAHGVYPKSIAELVQNESLRLSNEANALIKKYAPSIDQKTGKILLR